MRVVCAVLAAVAIAAAAGARQEPFEKVVERLASSDASARLAALRLLEEAGFPEAGAPIAALLRDPDERVQRAAVYTELGLFLRTRIETRRHVALVVEVRDSRPAAMAFERRFASLPVAPVPIEVVIGLLGPVRHPDPAFRAEAAYVLGILGQIEDTPPPAAYRVVAEALAAGLADPVPEVRIAIARSAGRLFDRCAVPCDLPGLDRLGDVLVHTLNDPDREVRLAALDAIGDLRWVRAVQALTAAYDYYEKGPDALSHLVALARVGHPASSAVFKAALSRKEDGFRRAGAEGLARLGGADAVFAARALATSGSRELLVTESFAAFRSGETKALDRLLHAVDAAPVRLQACNYLVEIGPPAASSVASALGAAGSQARVALLDTLGVVGGAAERAAVEALRADGDAEVAAAAERAAIRMTSRSKR